MPFYLLRKNVRRKSIHRFFFSSLIEIFSTSNMFNVVETADVIALIL